MPQNNKRGKHTCLGREVKRNLNKVEALTGVKKIILGLARSTRHSHKSGSLRIQRVEFEKKIIHLAAYDDKGIMDITILCHHTSDIDSTAALIGTFAG